MSADPKKTKQGSDKLWVLTDVSPVDETAKTLLPSTPSAIDPEKLGEQIQDFVLAFSKSLDKIQSVSVSGFDLTQISVDVKLSATLGLVLIGQAGVTGGITLTFSKK